MPAPMMTALARPGVSVMPRSHSSSCCGDFYFHTRLLEQPRPGGHDAPAESPFPEESVSAPLTRADAVGRYYSTGISLLTRPRSMPWRLRMMRRVTYAPIARTDMMPMKYSESWLLTKYESL